MVGKDPAQGGQVADVGLLKGVIGAVRHRRDIVETGGIGQRVEVDDLMPARDGQPHDGRSDKTGTAGDEDLHVLSIVKGLSKSARAGAAVSFSDKTGSVSPEIGQSMPQLSHLTAPSHSGA